ncbi:hypothetical protein PAPHI01_0626 [Pancytospora philotis]|nr:hypothetical protein PAPHI01_0626 [Pancytospora philotis]
MLWLFGGASALFLMHKDTGSYVGNANPKKPTLGLFSSAVDFVVGDGWSVAPYVTLSTPGGMAIDRKWESPGPIIYFKRHSKWNQSFLLILTADNDFVLARGLPPDKNKPKEFKDKEYTCLSWDEGRTQFITVGCKSAAVARFNLLYEVSYEPELAEDMANNEHADGEEHTRDYNGTSLYIKYHYPRTRHVVKSVRNIRLGLGDDPGYGYMPWEYYHPHHTHEYYGRYLYH